MPRVLISDKLESPGLDFLRQAGIELDERHGLTGAALQEAMRAADGIIVRSGTRVTVELLDNPGKLRAIVRAGVGVDHIDVAAATRKGIVVMNTPGGNTVSAAEHTITMLMALSRHIPAADASIHAGKWERGRFVGTQLAGKTLGVIGLGRIGREVARRAAGLDMKVVGFDPFLAPDKAAQLGIEGAVPSIDPGRWPAQADLVKGLLDARLAELQKLETGFVRGGATQTALRDHDIARLHIVFGRPFQHADAPHPARLLRARRERPCCCAAEKGDEVAALRIHSITSSARPSRVSEKVIPSALAVAPAS